MAGTSYTRQSTIADGNIITAALFNNEFNQILNAFAYASSGTTGHSHDGSAGQGAAISKIGDQDFKNKIECNSTDNRLEFSLEVGGASVEQIRIQDGAIVPVTDSDIDLGTNSVRFKDLYVDSISVGSHTIGTTTTFNDDVVFAGAASPGSKITFDKSLTALHFADNVKASFGGTSANPGDLIIYHDGQHSYIKDVGTGDLYVRGDASVHVGGNTSAPAITTTTGGVTFRAGNTTQAAVDTTGITLADDKIVSFGDDKDLKIYHDGTNSYIQDGGTGDLIIVAFDQIKMTQTTGVGSFPVAEFGISTGCELFHNTSKKFNTTSTGVTITGNTSISGSATAQTFNANAAIDTPTLEVTTLKSRDATTAGTIADSTGIVTLNSSVLTTTDINGGTIDGVTINGAVGSSHLTFADNHKAIFGNDGNELALYHNASDSIIEDQGTGSLLIKGTQLKLQSADGEDYATFTNNGPARLFNNGVEKFATSSTGATVTGRLNTGQIEVTTLRANDGTSAGSIADSTGVVTLASSVLTTADINGGTADNVVIGGSTAAAGNFTSLTATGQVTINAATPSLVWNDTDGNERTSIFHAGGIAYYTSIDSGETFGTHRFRRDTESGDPINIFETFADGDVTFYKANGTDALFHIDAVSPQVVISGAGSSNTDPTLVVDRTGTADGVILSLKSGGDTNANFFSTGGNRVIFCDNTNKGIKFTPSSVHPRTSTNGALNNTIDLGLSSSKFRNVYANGIIFDEVQGQASSNTLGDYEEGTWTPAYIAVTNSPSVTYDSGTGGHYTKVGRLVTLTGRIRTDAVDNSPGGTDAAGGLRISGLPFAVSSNVTELQNGTLHCGQIKTFTSGRFPAGGYAIRGSSEIALTRRGSSSGNMVNLDAYNTGGSNFTLSSGTNSNEIVFSVVYYTDE